MVLLPSLFYSMDSFCSMHFILDLPSGSVPIVGFQYGARDKQKLRNIYHTSFLFVAVSSVFMAVIAIVLSPTIVTIFTDDPATYELAAAGFRLFAINFLFSGISITSSGFFTACPTEPSPP